MAMMMRMAPLARFRRPVGFVLLAVQLFVWGWAWDMQSGAYECTHGQCDGMHGSQVVPLILFVVLECVALFVLVFPGTSETWDDDFARDARDAVDITQAPRREQMLRGVHVAETLLVVFASILVILVWFNAWTAEDGFRWWVPFGALLVAGIFRIAYQSLRVRHGEFSSVAARAVERKMRVVSAYRSLHMA